MRRLLILACVGGLLAACTTGCTTGPPRLGSDPVALNAKVDRVAERFAAVKLFAELLLPFVSPEAAAQIRAGFRAVDAAISGARAAATAGEQRVLLERARRETERIAAEVGIPPDR